jgi:hypothetical protein
VIDFPIRQQEDAMKRFLNYFRRIVQTKPACGKRPCTFRPQLEQLDDRLVPSALSSTISIQHQGWTERDWYTIDPSTGILEYSPAVYPYRQLAGPLIHDSFRFAGFGSPVAVSASIEPGNGSTSELFALGADVDGRTGLALWRSTGGWQWVQSDYWSISFHQYRAISATRDSHVYAVQSDGSHVYYLDSFGNGTDLGAPTGNGWNGIAFGPDCIAASVDAYGHNQVFAIGLDYAIYVNSANAPGQWRLVDNSTLFASLSATAKDTVFALTSGLPDGGGGQLYQETEQFLPFSWNGCSSYWTGQYIGGGRIFYSISADLDAYGRNEVYAIDVHADAYLYNQGTWTWKDSNVYDIVGAGDGYFDDVSYVNGHYYFFQWGPNGGGQ